MRRLFVLLLLSAVLISLGSCITRSAPEVSYYLLEYSVDSEKEDLRVSDALAQQVHIEDTELPRAFVRRQIVNRLEGQEFRYLRNHLWGDDLSETIPRLIESRIRRYGIFERTTRNFNRSREGYEIRSQLDRIEYVQWGSVSRALVEIEFELVNLDTEQVLIRRNERVEEDLQSRRVGDFVALANSILLNEIDLFLQQVSQELEQRDNDAG